MGGGEYSLNSIQFSWLKLYGDLTLEEAPISLCRSTKAFALLMARSPRRIKCRKLGELR